MNGLNGWEVGLVRGLHDALQSDFLDGLMPFVTKFSNGGVLWITLAVLFLLFRKTRRMGLTMGIALLFGFLLGNLCLKPLFARIRPYDFDSSLLLIIPPETEYSFPSGHSLAAFEGAFSIFLYHRRWGAAALLFAALTAFSRVYLQVHYPLDVLCGALLGIVFAWAAFRLVRLSWSAEFLRRGSAPEGGQGS